MLSPHEISTLMLIQRAPHQVELFGQSTARLRQEALVEIRRLPTGDPMPLLTPKGQDMLERLDALWKLRSRDTDVSE
ncbi:hypothetical protein BTHE68_27470 [Burkholderia sp. THE68]|uniref:hypothetical protein n=1 Tax=Burkholderia sp. THE68 TaxID=758782 RepID=UPI001317D1A6|nr:hypothetical protein [Burkholderia sp. THE68]BBU29013.1 hypothetical protein BTHE68_27470 [Burkholderia sp. THE68]